MISCFVLVQVSLALRFSLSVIEYYHLDDHPFISSWRACCHSDILQRLLRLYKLIELGVFESLICNPNSNLDSSVGYETHTGHYSKGKKRKFVNDVQV